MVIPSKDDGEGPVRHDDLVYRRTRPWTASVHSLLIALQRHDFANAPLSAGHDATWERASFLPGETGDLGDNENMRSMRVLQSAARLLRRYHDCTALFMRSMLEDQKWQLPPRLPFEVICHGDFAPYNVVLNSGAATGIIDFETAHPGPRCWDLAYAIYRWAPLSAGVVAKDLGELDTQILRARSFLNAYDLPSQQRSALPGMILDRLNVLVGFMELEAANGVERYRRNVEEGHADIYRRDIAYIKEHQNEIMAGFGG
ncbi:aminoglycoside phosphotransferase family protein [Rhizobium calliandrae]|uniref:Aminoglycoside phosphotransferase family protein n=1 Tax=Rhizobium calliandrae TaxID=1312182 RepID=A0ABT7KI50_9HYPH|nr:aminoglycoside phosphotransferase family protein [Rhizobium calliandrae]MDL2408314.1 aminoglycoside phosphotransferase family protein [Rhizobium calliandrae]